MNKERVKKGNVFLIPSLIAEDTLEKAITPQVKEVILNTKFYLAENIRTARRFISSLKLGITIEDLQFELMNKKTTSSQIKEYFKPVFEGHNLGILSEAGCPGIADPGSQAVQYAHQNKIKVIPLVGPCSIVMALMASGFNGQSFVFHGYVPIDKIEKEKFIKEMEEQATKKKQTQIFMDTPFRNEKLFQDLVHICKENTLLNISKDITGKDELILSQSIKNWKSQSPALHKYPVIFSLFVE